MSSRFLEGRACIRLQVTLEDNHLTNIHLPSPDFPHNSLNYFDSVMAVVKVAIVQTHDSWSVGTSGMGSQSMILMNHIDNLAPVVNVWTFLMNFVNFVEPIHSDGLTKSQFSIVRYR